MKYFPLSLPFIFLGLLFVAMSSPAVAQGQDPEDYDLLVNSNFNGIDGWTVVANDGLDPEDYVIESVDYGCNTYLTVATCNQTTNRFTAANLYYLSQVIQVPAGDYRISFQSSTRVAVFITDCVNVEPNWTQHDWQNSNGHYHFDCTYQTDTEVTFMIRGIATCCNFYATTLMNANFIPRVLPTPTPTPNPTSTPIPIPTPTPRPTVSEPIYIGGGICEQTLNSGQTQTYTINLLEDGGFEDNSNAWYISGLDSPIGLGFSFAYASSVYHESDPAQFPPVYDGNLYAYFDSYTGTPNGSVCQDVVSSWDGPHQYSMYLTNSGDQSLYLQSMGTRYHAPPGGSWSSQSSFIYLDANIPASICISPAGPGLIAIDNLNLVPYDPETLEIVCSQPESPTSPYPTYAPPTYEPPILITTTESYPTAPITEPIDHGETCWQVGPFDMDNNGDDPDDFGFELCLHEWSYEFSFFGIVFKSQQIGYVAAVGMILSFLRMSS